MSAAVSSGQEAPSSSTGVNIVELQPGANLQQLQGSLGADPHVEFVSRVPIRYLLARRRPAAPRAAAATLGGGTIAKTPPVANTMWNIRKINWPQARAGGMNMAGDVKVAVLDTGIDLGHPDLPGSQINYTHDYPESQASTSDQDIIGHGTHVSGTIRALIDNSLGSTESANANFPFTKSSAMSRPATRCFRHSRIIPTTSIRFCIARLLPRRQMPACRSSI